MMHVYALEILGAGTAVSAVIALAALARVAWIASDRSLRGEAARETLRIIRGARWPRLGS
jgi:hypothetical protein